MPFFSIFNRYSLSKRPKTVATLVRWLFVSVLIVGLAGCVSRQMTVRAVTDIVDDGMSAYEKDDDLDFLEKAFPAHIKLLEALLANDPKNIKLLVLLSRSYASYAFIFFDGRIEAAQLSTDRSDAARVRATALTDTAAGYYRKGAEYALRALEIRNPNAARLLSTISTADAFIRQIGTPDLPALFWYGFNLSGDINLKRDSIGAIAGAYRVEKAMQRALEIDESYFHGVAHLVLFGYYAMRSPHAGGHPELALQHYQRIKQMHGDSFMLADLYYARYYLYQRQERPEFMAVLQGILDEPSQDENFQLFNRVAKDRARIYIDAADDLFID